MITSNNPKSPGAAMRELSPSEQCAVGGGAVPLVAAYLVAHALLGPPLALATTLGVIDELKTTKAR